ncbi:MAG TPA: leucyl/phenylalanyl-tRNA--protein transferase [Ignavibacteriaceae bacterium]|nr:leucyl/phenylalanyl-tRNA--protein transferase [Ignavibacteriaceae bacterium]
MSENQRYNEDELLRPGNMIRLYASGAFPMADEKTDRINWYMPELRTIIPIDKFNYPRSLKKFLERNNYETRFDTDFLKVVHGCADRDSTWISHRLIEAYLRLKKLGYVHTVETWENEKLIGGLYGVTFRGAFFGESMFSRKPQASKSALINLLLHLREKNFALLDVQFLTPHLKMFGAVEIGMEQYTDLLNTAYIRGCEF